MGNLASFIYTTLENGEKLTFRIKELLDDAAYRQKMFQLIGEKPGITPRDIRDFEANLSRATANLLRLT